MDQAIDRVHYLLELWQDQNPGKKLPQKDIKVYIPCNFIGEKKIAELTSAFCEKFPSNLSYHYDLGELVSKAIPQYTNLITEVISTVEAARDFSSKSIRIANRAKFALQEELNTSFHQSVLALIESRGYKKQTSFCVRLDIEGTYLFNFIGLLIKHLSGSCIEDYKTVSQLISLSLKSIKNGEINVAIARILDLCLAQLLMPIEASQECKTTNYYNNSWCIRVFARSLMGQEADSYGNIFLELEREILFQKYDRSTRNISLPVYNLFSKLITIIGDKDELAFFYDLNPEHFNSPTKVELVQRNLEIGNLEGARKYLDDLRIADKFNPMINVLDKDVIRLNKIQKLSNSVGVNVTEINDLSGKEFEELLIQKFKSLGFKALETPSSGDYGADIIVTTSNDTVIVIQCKRFKAKVNLKAVQEVTAALPHYGGDFGIVITNSGFLKSAYKLAESNDIELWGGDELLDFLSGDILFSEISNL